MSKAFTKDEGDASSSAQPIEALPPGPRLITADGLARFRSEYEQLLAQRPACVAARLAGEGDVESEHRLQTLDRRIGWLARRLPLWTEGPRASARDRVAFGVRVTALDDDGTETTWRLVGPDEVDLEPGNISVSSPVAAALIGKRIGDEVTLRRPKGDLALTVVRIDV
ncbi:MAG: GreA/GreB family elongation factor [Myxococcales bacterium]|nr:GreA/GreB family elongation factor [Myxococcales bacterium]